MAKLTITLNDPNGLGKLQVEARMNRKDTAAFIQFLHATNSQNAAGAPLTPAESFEAWAGRWMTEAQRGVHRMQQEAAAQAARDAVPPITMQHSFIASPAEPE